VDVWEERRRVVEDALPGLEPSSALYQSLIGADAVPLVGLAAAMQDEGTALSESLMPTDDALSFLMAKHSLMQPSA
jgi:hypothetical protein